VNMASGACTEGDDGLDVLWDDGKRIFCRGWRTDDAGNKSRSRLLVGTWSCRTFSNRVARRSRVCALETIFIAAWPSRFWSQR
jgi:hypothetical protein